MAGNEPAVRLDRPTSPVVRPRTHFQVPAREMLLDEPICCPIYGALTFDGLAIDHEERVHLVVRTAAARAYLGPDSATVARRAHILVCRARGQWGDRFGSCGRHRRVAG